MIREQYGEPRPFTEQDEQFMVAMRYIFLIKILKKGPFDQNKNNKELKFNQKIK